MNLFKPESFTCCPLVLEVTTIITCLLSYAINAFYRFAILIPELSFLLIHLATHSYWRPFSLSLLIFVTLFCIISISTICFWVGSIRMIWSNQSPNIVFLCDDIMVMISFGVYYWDSWVCVYVCGFFCCVGWFYLFVFKTCEDLVAFCPMLSWHFIELPITAKVHSWWIMIQRSSIYNFTHWYKRIFHLSFYFFIRHCLDVLQFIAISFCTICADFVTSLFTLFSK